MLKIQRVLRHQDNVRPAVRRAQRDITGVPTHHFDDRDSPVAFRRRANSLHAASRYEDGGGVSWSDIINDVLQIKHRLGSPQLVAKSAFGVLVFYPPPFVRFIWMVEPKIN